MTATTLLALSLLALGIFIGIIWRFSSRCSSLPCPVWLSWLVELDNPFAKTNRARTIIRNLHLQPGMTVLDMGCGPGRVSVPLALKIGPPGKVVAMDIQEGMLKRAQEKALDAGVDNIEFLLAGAGEGKIGQNRFDRALLVTVLGEIPDREAAIKEIHAALKPEGILSITEIIFDPHFQSRTAVSNITQKIGFQEETYFGNRFAYTLNVRKIIAAE